MKINLESTAEIRTVQGARCRVWQGHTESGIPIYAYVKLVAVPGDERQEEFHRELAEQPHAPVAIDVRLLL